MNIPELGDRAVNAVFTTGIYCRAGCAGRPLPINRAEYRSVFAAEAAGFRACLRCRPDRRANPLIDGDTPEIVRQALALISEGQMDGDSSHALATKIGVSGRHLARLFERHIGATPAQVAQSRRAHFARRLLDETDLKMGELAFASGFQSVRQLNRVMMAIFQFTPSELRSKRRRDDRLVLDGGMRLRLPIPCGYDFNGMLKFLGPRLIPGVESISDGVYRRITDNCGFPGVIEVKQGGGEDQLELVAHLPTYAGLLNDVGRVQSLLGLSLDTSLAHEVLAEDELIGPLVRASARLPFVGAWDRFETSIRIIVGQQISVKAASQIAGQLARQFGSPVAGLGDYGLTHIFPTPLELAAEDLSDFGMPGARIRTITEFSRCVADGELDLYSHDELPLLLTKLERIPGVGPWTANLIALRVFGQPDAFPSGDTGLQRAAGHLVGRDRIPGDELLGIAEQWRPWRGMAATVMWMTQGETETSSTARTTTA
ncbi:MAG: DNA-3-methyladenine glycosylase 2 family protein [Chloroflexi bacterium]|nr:DNA-3-methyladenine glycosylase 2 family protein [Chloroflexota bacterium]